MSEQNGYKEVTGMPVIDIRKEGESIEGKYLRTQAGQYGDNYILMVDGEEKLLFTSTVIQTKMLLVPVGKTVRITSLGEKKSKDGRLYKDFKVEVKA